MVSLREAEKSYRLERRQGWYISRVSIQNVIRVLVQTFLLQAQLRCRVVLMNLPRPDASDELIAYLDEVGSSANGWGAISIELQKRLDVDTETVALKQAFDLILKRTTGHESKSPPAFVMPNGRDLPRPCSELPKEVAALWASTASRLSSPAPRARLHHLLYECQYGNKREHAQKGAEAYLELGAGSWDLLGRVRCLCWALKLFAQVKDLGVKRVTPLLVALVDEGLNCEPPNAGAALDSLEALLEDGGDDLNLPELFHHSKERFSSNYIVLQKIINLQEKMPEGDPEVISRLRREGIEAMIADATGKPGGARMGLLSNAAKLATKYHFGDLVTRATTMMQQVPGEELGLTTSQVVGSVPGEVIEGVIRSIVNRDSFADVLRAAVTAGSPTGDLDNNRRAMKTFAEQAPFASSTARAQVREDGLPLYTPTSEEEVVDQQLARIEILRLQAWGEIIVLVLESSLARFSPSQDEITDILQELPHVSAPVAHSLARAILDFGSGLYEEAATVAMPRIESLVRELCEATERLEFRVQRDQKDRPSIPGQYPQLGALLPKLKDKIDPSWYRFFQTFLVSPSGLNFRNELLHGNVDEVTRSYSALTILGSLYLTLVGLMPAPANPVGD